MKCDWCKQELASDDPVALLAMCEPVSQKEAGEYGEDSFVWREDSYVLTVCMDCAQLLDSLFGRLIKIDLEAACPFCNPRGLCPTCRAKTAD